MVERGALNAKYALSWEVAVWGLPGDICVFTKLVSPLEICRGALCQWKDTRVHASQKTTRFKHENVNYGYWNICRPLVIAYNNH